MKKDSSQFVHLLAGTAVLLVFVAASVFVLLYSPSAPVVRAQSAAELAETIGGYGSGTGELFAFASGDTVTVTGSRTGANSTLSLAPEANVTVVWQAAFAGSIGGTAPLISIEGSGGTFRLEDGGSVTQNGVGRGIQSSGNVTVTGGSVSATSGTAVYATGTESSVVVSGGKVFATVNGGRAIHAFGLVTASDCEIYAPGSDATSHHVIFGASATSHIKVLDGAQVYVSSGQARAIQSSGDVTVEGGDIRTAGTTGGSAVYTGGADSKVVITGGVLTVTGTGTAAGAITGANASVFIGGSAVVQNTNPASSGNSYAVECSGDVTITGEAVVSSASGNASSAAVNCTGADAYITVSGNADVTAASARTVFASGARASLTVSNNAVIKNTGNNYAVRMDGQYAVVTMSGGLVENSSGANAAIYLSSTSNTGRNLSVTGGTVKNTGGNAIASNGTAFVNGGVLEWSGAPFWTGGSSYIGIVRTGYTNAYNAGTSTELAVYGGTNSSAVWANEGEAGIRYTRGSVTGFFATPGVTVSVADGADALYINDGMTTLANTNFVSAQACMTAVLAAIPDDGSITVTGKLTGTTAVFTLNIAAAKTVVWMAEISGNVTLTNNNAVLRLEGTGTFILAEDGENVGKVIQTNTTTSGDGIQIRGSNVVRITGGEVRCPTGDTIWCADAPATLNAAVYVSGGLVTANSGDPTIRMLNTAAASVNVTISGGTVQKTGAGDAVSTYGSIEISGGTVSATTGNAILAQGANASVTISGVAQVSATTGNAVNASGANASVAVSSGQVYVTTGTAIYTAGANSSVAVSGGKVSATSTGTGIYASGAVVISGGEVYNYGTATTHRAVYLTGADSSVTVTGTGKVYVAAETGAGRAVDSYGGKIRIEGDAEVWAGGGCALVTNSAAASIEIAGGTVTNAGSAASGVANSVAAVWIYTNSVPGLAFRMSGGTVCNTGNNGVAVYVNGNHAGFIESGEVLATGAGGRRFYTDTNGVVIERAGNTNSYKAGTRQELNVLPASAEAVWETVGGVVGIQFAYGANRGFFEVPGVTLDYTDVAGLFVNGDTAKPLTNTDAAQKAIQDALDAAGSGGTVTVTGTLLNTAAPLNLSATDRTIIWKAQISGYANPVVSVTGGHFIVADDGDNTGKIRQTNASNFNALNSTGNITVSGGEVSAGTGTAIYTSGANSAVTISGGKVYTTAGITVWAVGASAAVTVSGGEVYTTGTSYSQVAIRTDGASSVITVRDTGKVHIADNGGGRTIQAYGEVRVEGGEVLANGECAIVAHYSTATVRISGGLVQSSGTSTNYPTVYMYNATSGVNLHITDGTVKNTGNNGYAIRPYTAGVVFIDGGLVDAVGSGGQRFSTGGMVIERTGDTNSYKAGSTAELALFPLNTEAVWETVDGVNGIQYAYGAGAGQRGFFEVSGVTLSYDGVTGLYVNGSAAPLTNSVVAQDAIQRALNAVGVGESVTVAGMLLNVTNTIALTATNKTLIWDAEIEGNTGSQNSLLKITGGEFILAANGSVTQNGGSSTDAVESSGNITINGGTARANTGSAIWASAASSVVTVHDGFIVSASTNTSDAGIYMSGSSSLLIVKGTEASTQIYATANGGPAIYSQGKVFIEGGIVSALTGCAIYTLGANAYAEISGGTVQNSGTNGTGSPTASTIYLNSSSLAALNFLMTGGVLKNTSGSAAACLLYMNGAAFIRNGVTECAGATTPFYMYTGITIDWRPTHKSVYTAGTGEDFTTVSRTAGATAVWARPGGVSGIQCTVGSNSIFFAVPGVTVVSDEELYVSGSPEPLTDPATAVTAIQAALNASGVDIVTVTGRLTRIGTTLSLTIPAGKTLIWQAQISGGAAEDRNALFRIIGGTFILDGGSVTQTTQTGTSRAVSVEGTVSNRAIFVMTGGEIKAGAGGSALYMYNNYVNLFDISGGLIENAGTSFTSAAIDATGSTGTLNLRITNGAVVRNTGNGGYCVYGNGVTYIDGGTVEKTGTGAAWFYGTSSGTAVTRTASADAYVAGSKTDLEVATDLADLRWAADGGKHGIYFRLSDSYSGFFEVPGVAVTYTGAQGLKITGSETLYTDAESAQAAIWAALTAAPANGAVTVTGTLTDVRAALTFTVPAGKTLRWDAALSGSTATGSANALLTISGGTLAVTESGSVIQSGAGYAIYSNSAVTVAGGTVKATTNNAIYVSSAPSCVTVTGGLVENAGTSASNAAIYVNSNSSVAVCVIITGGTVKNTGNNGYVVYSAGVIFVNGGTVLKEGTGGGRFSLINATSMAIERTGITNLYGAGTSAEISVEGAGATAVWVKRDGVPGISYSRGANTGFIAVADVTVTVESVELTGTALISNPNPRYNDVLTGSLSDGNNAGVLTYTWFADGEKVETGKGAGNATYTVKLPDIGKVITLEITSDVEEGAVISEPTAIVLRATQAAPTAPTLNNSTSFTHNSITLSSLGSRGEYSIDGENWQTSREFTGLDPDTSYTFYRRYAADETREASPASPGFTTKTALARVNINGLSAATGLTYNAQQQAGFMGTPTFTIVDTGEPVERALSLTYTYTGRNSTSNPPGGAAPKNWGDYRVTISVDDSGYSGSIAIDFSIARKTLTWTQGVVEDKIYDGTTAAKIITEPALEGIIGGDIVNITKGTVVFANSNPNAEVNKTVTASGWSIIGADSSNYIRAATNPTFAPATVFKISIAWTIGAVEDKTYDGSTAADVKTKPQPSGVLPGEIGGVTIYVGGAVFESKDAGKSVAVKPAADWSVTGAFSVNYDIGQPTFANAEIFKKELAVGAITPLGRTYNGTTEIGFTGGAVSGKIGADNVGVTIALSVANADAGADKAVLVSYTLTGADRDNYKPPSAPTELTVDIGKVKVAKPALLITQFEENGDPKTVALNAEGPYTLSGDVTQTDVGRYAAVVSLLDNINSEWADGTSADLSLVWEIKAELPIKTKIPKPTVTNSGLTYTGGVLSAGIATNPAYTVANGSGTNAGNYTATVSLTDTANYEWADGSTADLQLPWSIAKAKVAKPTLTSAQFDYDGAAKTVVLSASGVYTLSNDITKTEAGNYTATVALNDKVNYEWSDGTIADLALTWSIAEVQIAAKTKIAKPSVANTDLVYTGSELSAGIAANAAYTATNDKKTDAGDYSAAVTLSDKEKYEWDDGTTTDLTLSWSIAKAPGGTVPAPAAASKTKNSITITAVTGMGGGTVEYAIARSDAAPSDPAVWQTGLTFTGLDADAAYYVFARVKGDDNRLTGTASPGATVTTEKESEKLPEKTPEDDDGCGCGSIAPGSNPTAGLGIPVLFLIAAALFIFARNCFRRVRKTNEK
ncbi:MAG: YDG domain-containing protein [Firmicutes bacterium]|nr:YDG domain-containing protein [Bacillota bacterium]